MTDDRIEALRADVARHTGKARAEPLIALGQALADRYWRLGPGQPRSLPVLDEAVTVLDEAYDHLEPGAYLRGQVACMLGWLVGTRHVAHAGPERDRETGILLLGESLAFPQLPRVLQAMARIVLSQLLMSRTTRSMQAPDFAMRLMRNEMPAGESTDVDQAVVLLRQVVDGPAISTEITTAATTMLSLAETMQSLTGGLGGGGFDLGRMVQTLSDLQRQQTGGAQRPSPAGPLPNPFDVGGLPFTPTAAGPMPNLIDFGAADRLARTDPIDRPSAVVDGEVPPVTTAARERPPAPPPAHADTLRPHLLEKLPGPGFAALLPLLDGPGPIPDADAVDELVALASSLVEAPGSLGTDHLLHAVALHLRGAADDGGWGDAQGDAGTDDATAEALAAACAALPAASDDAVAVAVHLAGLLDARQPAGDVGARLGEGFAAVTEALRTVGADGLVYRVAGETLLLSAATGRLSITSAGLPPRVIVIGDEPVADDLTVSHVASAAQLVELAGRTRLPLSASAVFVANPRGDRKQATLDALTLRRACYPRSVGLGQTAEHGDGAGTPAEVCAHLHASLLHLGCGVTVEGGLELAGPAVLEAGEIRATGPATNGGLAVLPSAGEGGAALTEALLASGFVGVIGFRRPVDPDVTSLVHLMLHAQLVDKRRDPASAVKAVRDWMADPDRKLPDWLPAWCEGTAADPALADPATQGALIHHGV